MIKGVMRIPVRESGNSKGILCEKNCGYGGCRIEFGEKLKVVSTGRTNQTVRGDHEFIAAPPVGFEKVGFENSYFDDRHGEFPNS